MSVCSALATNLATLHRALIAFAGATAFTAPPVATGLLASPALSTLICAAAAPRAIAVLLAFVACHKLSSSKLH